MEKIYIVTIGVGEYGEYQEHNVGAYRSHQKALEKMDEIQNNRDNKEYVFELYKDLEIIEGEDYTFEIFELSENPLRGAWIEDLYLE